MATDRALSIEDRKLGTATVIGSRTKLYKDIDLSFAKQPNVGDIYKKSDAAAVKQAMRNLLSTNHLRSHLSLILALIFGRCCSNLLMILHHMKSKRILKTQHMSTNLEQRF